MARTVSGPSRSRCPTSSIFLAFVLYPIAYGLWMGSDPALYRQLFDDPRYLTAVINTLFYVGIGVNVKMAWPSCCPASSCARDGGSKRLLVIFILPWATPALPAYMSIHWFLNGQWGMLNNMLYVLFGIDGPVYLNDALDWGWPPTSAPISGRTCRSGR